MRGKSHDASRPRMSAVAATLMLVSLVSAGGISTSEAKTVKQCTADLKTGHNRCYDLPQPEQCYGQAWRQYNKCRCAANGGVYSENLGTPHCTGGKETYSLSPPEWPKKPKGPQQGTPQPLSDPKTPTKPQGPGSVGTPPKSNPTTGVKPKSPGSVGSPPKSNSSSGGGGGTILRSGNSGNSNSNKSGGGNSGGSSGSKR
jgi:hypothetical protein